MRKALSVLAATSLLLVATAAPALASHTWRGFHWARTAAPLTLELGDNSTTAEWSAILARSSADWSKAKALDTVVAAGLTNDPQACQPTPGRVEVCNGRYGEQLWVGIATIWLDPNGHIVQGTVKNNDSFLYNPKYPRYNNPEARRYVMCQEIGHTFGLDHQDADFNNESLGTCMDYTRDFENNLTPNRHDFQQLEASYGHADSYDTAGAADALASGSASATAGSRVSRVETVLPNGYRMISWIIWP